MQPTLEDLLAQWWRESYPNANLNTPKTPKPLLSIREINWLVDYHAA
jgi:hypothetical protein